MLLLLDLFLVRRLLIKILCWIVFKSCRRKKKAGAYVVLCLLVARWREGAPDQSRYYHKELGSLSFAADGALLDVFLVY